jgi:outer membrane receptor protein involved in Fe transport
MTARLNVNNIADEKYISESETNILFNPSTETREIGDNGSTRNIVYYGFGRTWNAGLKIKF